MKVIKTVCKKCGATRKIRILKHPNKNQAYRNPELYDWKGDDACSDCNKWFEKECDKATEEECRRA